MSEIHANIVVQPLDLNVTVEQPTITVAPEALGLQFYLGGIGVPGGNVNTVQYNAGGVLGGIPSVTWTGSKLSLGDTNNITISGGSANYALITDGTGNLSWGPTANANYANFAGNAVYSNNANIANVANVAYSVSAANITGTIANSNYAAYAGNITIAAQPNITSLGNLTSLKVVGTANLGNVSNLKITGGTNGYVLQTDGTGNLSWVVSATGSGNGVPGGSNAQIQYNDGGLFGGTAGFTFNKSNNLVSMPGSLSVTGNLNTIGKINVFGGLLVGSEGTTSIQQATEQVKVVASSATGNINFDVIGNAIMYYTGNATNNFTLNIRGNSTTTLNSLMSNNQSLTCTFLNTNGNVGYYMTALTIDGTSVTPRYAGGPPVSGSVAGIDTYNFNIIKTAANTYSVLVTIGGYTT